MRPVLPDYRPPNKPGRPRIPSSLLIVAESRMNIVTRFLLELQEMSLLAGRAARGLFQKAALHSRDHRADGQHRRRLADDHYSHRLFHRRRADAANLSHARVVRGRQPTRLSGVDFAGARTGPGADGVDGDRSRGFGNLSRVGLDGSLPSRSTPCARWEPIPFANW